MSAMPKELRRSILTGPPCPDNLQSITQSFLTTVRRSPTNLALSSPSQPHDLYNFPSQPLKARRKQQDAVHDAIEDDVLDHEYQRRPWLRWSYTTLFDAADLFGSALARRGATPGRTPVFTLLHSGVESWMCLWASHLGRYTWAPLHPGNLRNAPELTYMVQTVLENCPGSDAKDEDEAETAVVVVVVDSAEIADSVDAVLGAVLGERSVVKIIAGDNDSDSPTDGWTSMGVLLNDERARRVHQSAGAAETASCRGVNSDTHPEDRLIFFTSGSTALPKGCAWQHPQSAIRLAPSQAMSEYTQSASSSNGSNARMYIPLPTSHAAAYICVMPWILLGGAVVLPTRRRSTTISPPSTPTPTASIEPEAMLSDIKLESCTDFLTVPTMVGALAAANETARVDLSGVSIIMAGASATDTHLRSCFDHLGVMRVVNYWGMSESINLCPAFITRNEYAEYQRGPENTAWFLHNGSDVSIGVVPHATSIKVCGADDSTDPAPLSSPGELHVSSPTLIQRYLGAQASNSGFYTDEAGMQWYNTGDEAMINEAGQVFLTGRHKEVIVRGGEKISPVAMETAIARNPRLAKLDILVVGTPDAIAGHLPVAVIRQQPGLELDPETVAMLHQTILSEMGPIFVPAAVLTLDALGLEDWPKTTIGKLQRGKVASRVEEFLKQKRATSTTQSLSVTTDAGKPKGTICTKSLLSEQAQRVWADAIGIADLGQLPMDKPIRSFSDSITLMRVRAGILKETGIALSLAEMIEADTIDNLLEVLLARKNAASSLPPTPATSEEGEDRDDRDAFRSIKKEGKLAVNHDQQSAITTSLRACGLGWEDCTTLIVPPDMNEILSRHAAFNGWSPSFVLRFSGQHDIRAVQQVLGRLFKLHPLLLSHYVRTDSHEAFHALLRHEPHVLEKFIKVRHDRKIRSVSDLLAVPRGYSALQGPASVPGLVAHAEIFKVQEPEPCTGLVLTVNHVIVDATYAEMILSDLEAILSNDISNSGRYTGYDVWAEAYHSRRTSPEAKAVTDWHISQLHDLHLHESNIWPLPRAEENDGQHQHEFKHDFSLSKTDAFRDAHPEIQPSTIFKTAMILAVAATTNQKYVAISSCEAARSRMPFTTTSNATEEAVDVAGPTYSLVFEQTSLSDTLEVSELLQQLEKRQHKLTMNATACWHDIYARLTSESGSDIVRALEKLTFALAFNWVPPDALAAHRNEQMQLLETYFPSVGGLEVQCGLGGDPLGQQIASIQLSGTGLDVDEMKRFALMMEKALKMIMCCKGQDRDAPLLVTDVLDLLKVPEDHPVAQPVV